MKNILGKIKKSACLALAVLTVVSATGCMFKDKTREMTEAECKAINKIIAEDYNTDDYRRKCENAFVDSFLDNNYQSVLMYEGKEENEEGKTPSGMLKELIRVRCPFSINTIETNDGTWDEEEKCFKIKAKMSVIHLRKIYNNEIINNKYLLSGQNLLEMSLPTKYNEDKDVVDDFLLENRFKEYCKRKEYLGKSYLDVEQNEQTRESKEKFKLAFLIDYMSFSDSLDEHKVSTDIELIAKEEKGKWTITTSQEDILEQIKGKFTGNINHLQ